MRLFAPDAPAAAVTAVLPPAGLDSGVIVKELKSRFAAVITNGQGDMKGQIFRIAHLGFFDYMDTISLIGALEPVSYTHLFLVARKSVFLAVSSVVFNISPIVRNLRPW